MKKHILSASLALAMVISLLAGMSISVFAMHPYDFNIAKDIHLDNNVVYTSKSPKFDGTGIIKDDGGSIKREGNTLILNNVTINSGENDGIDIYFDDVNFTDSAIIILKGTNKITTADGYDSICTQGKCNGANKPSLTIQSESGSQGTLEVNSRIYNNQSDLAIKNSTVKANCSGYNGIDIYAGDLSIIGSTVTATGNKGIYTKIMEVKNEGDVATGGNITITDSIVTATANDVGIYANGGNIGITNSTVTATAVGTGFKASKGMAITNCNTVIATSTASNGFGMAVGDGGVTITKSNVNVTGAYGVTSEGGDITVQSGSLTVKSTYKNGAAVAASGNINLGTGMFIKTGGNIFPCAYGGGNIAVIAPTKDVSFDGNSYKFTGAALDVEIRGPGTVSVQQPQKPSNISSVTLPSETDLQNAVLTQADRAAIANGTNVNIQMVINSVQAPADSDKVKQSLGQNTLGMYLDISILKTVGDTQTAVHNLNSKIRITFTIPENLRGKDKYYVIRVHDGVTTVLEDLDNDPNTVTFETDQFSTYALVYPSSAPTSKSAKTGDDSNIIALAITAASSLAGIALINKKKF